MHACAHVCAYVHACIFVRVWGEEAVAGCGCARVRAHVCERERERRRQTDGASRKTDKQTTSLTHRKGARGDREKLNTTHFIRLHIYFITDKTKPIQTYISIIIAVGHTIIRMPGQDKICEKRGKFFLFYFFLSHCNCTLKGDRREKA